MLTIQKNAFFLKKCIKKLRVLKRFLSLCKSTKQFIIFSGKAYFYLTLPYNKHNNWYLGESAQEYGIEVRLHDYTYLVWWATSANRVFGPNIFDGTVSSTNYLKMPKVLRTRDHEKCYFQQDGASPHKAALVQTWLTERFGEKFIVKNEWPPRSPDLNPCDYFCGSILSRKCTIQSVTKNIGGSKI
jgi:hypothetical protein